MDINSSLVAILHGQAPTTITITPVQEYHMKMPSDGKGKAVFVFSRRECRSFAGNETHDQTPAKKNRYNLSNRLVL